ncbi:MAG TPA: MqnA/MqnD/SBP family protein [Thermoanaerobaculia bacterium]|nr:MqnA/MqnD/SBP family protein [Thermoanaerobaculia bacterium]
MPKLRVGIGDVLDAKPLAWGLLKGHHADLFSPVVEPLPLVGRLLVQGDLEAGLVPVIDAAQPPPPDPSEGRPAGASRVRPAALLALPDLCVAFPGAARSIVLASASPLSEVRRVYLGRGARKAAAVARIVLAEAWGIAPAYLAEDAPAAAGGAGVGRLEPGEAALVIGGPALRLSGIAPDDRAPAGARSEPAPLHLLDLGTAWHELTGLPLVVGLWVVRSDAVLPELPFYFKSSLRYGLASRSAIAREEAAELGFDSAEIERFLRETVSFVLRDDELRSIEELLRRAARHGLVPEGSAVRFLP